MTALSFPIPVCPFDPPAVFFTISASVFPPSLTHIGTVFTPTFPPLLESLPFLLLVPLSIPEFLKKQYSLSKPVYLQFFGTFFFCSAFLTCWVPLQCALRVTTLLSSHSQMLHLKKTCSLVILFFTPSLGRRGGNVCRNMVPNIHLTEYLSGKPWPCLSKRSSGSA